MQGRSGEHTPQQSIDNLKKIAQPLGTFQIWGRGSTMPPALLQIE
jgi:hypothetical protein